MYIFVITALEILNDKFRNLCPELQYNLNRGVPWIRPGRGRRMLFCTFAGEMSVEQGGMGGVGGT